MARQRHLKHAPIREALIDIQFGPAVAIELVRKSEPALRDKVKNASDIWQASIGLQFQAEGMDGPTTKRSLVGRRYDFADGVHVLQNRINGFTFSRLPPYEDWAQISSRARECWRCLVEHVPNATITRIAVRYINALALPLPIADFGEFLVSPPRIPAALPQGLSGFMYQVVMADQASGSSAIVTQALESPPMAATSVAVLLDIDAFRPVDFSVKNEGQIWNTLDQLRDLKNRIFFEHLTERTVGLFE